MSNLFLNSEGCEPVNETLDGRSQFSLGLVSRKDDTFNGYIVHSFGEDVFKSGGEAPKGRIGALEPMNEDDQ